MGLADVGAAYGQTCHSRVERAVAVGAHIADLRVAHGAHDEVAVDGRAAVGAGAVVLQLVLAQGDLELLLVAVDSVRRRRRMR